MSTDTSFYTDGAKRMAAEGIEAANRIMAFITQNEHRLLRLDVPERKKAILEFEPSKMFNQVHPIVFQYLAVEGIFNANAFRRYVMAVFGKPKSVDDQERIRSGRRYMYHYKNAQYALYYKYLLIETNPNVNKNVIHGMYEDMVNALNEDTDNMLNAYEKAEAEAKVTEEKLTDAKRQDLVDLLKKRFTEQID